MLLWAVIFGLIYVVFCGNLGKKRNVSDRNRVILLTEENDKAFARMAGGSRVTGATLPSGLKVPSIGNLVIFNG